MNSKSVFINKTLCLLLDLTQPLLSKAELLQLKPHPFICMRNFINKKVGNQKTKPTLFISVFNIEWWSYFF